LCGSTTFAITPAYRIRRPRSDRSSAAQSCP
jgi:hypothetical protein